MKEKLFKLKHSLKHSKEQQKAISFLSHSIREQNKYQLLKGVTGCGKTFTVAGVIEQVQMPVLVIVHNKSLANQLYEDLKGYFPENKVELFMSCFDYFRPEFFLKSKNILMEKESIINDEMDAYRMSAIRTLLSGRKDVIVVASVSCLYSIGDPDSYSRNKILVEKDTECDYEGLLRQLVLSGYTREDVSLKRGTFQVNGENVKVWPGYGDKYYSIDLAWDIVERIMECSVKDESYQNELSYVELYPQSLGMYPREGIKEALVHISEELEQQCSRFVEQGKNKQAKILRERVEYDMQMLSTTGSCKAMDNYAFHLMKQAKKKKRGFLMDLFPAPFLTIIDECHVTVPQMQNMIKGDTKRKEELIEQGFRLPSIRECHPVSFEEFEQISSQIVFVSATPGELEMKKADSHFIKQVIRPTYVLDPSIEVRTKSLNLCGEDLLKEITNRADSGEQTIVMTCTKREAEEINEFICANGIRSRYLHSDLNITERVDILEQLLAKKLQCIVGVNAVREGLDFPDVSLVIILDADKKGLLRTKTALMQMVGRASRHVNGHVIMYADTVTEAMQAVIDENAWNRKIQIAYNQEHGVTPEKIVAKRTRKEALPEKKEEKEFLSELEDVYKTYNLKNPEDREKIRSILKEKLITYAEEFEFAKGLKIRQEIERLERME